MKAINIILGTLLTISSLTFAGATDFAEQVVYTMPQEAYEYIYLNLGDGCSDYEIANEYMSNKTFYDSLSE